MKLLLDTHSFLWFISGSSRLSSTPRQLIEEATNQPYLSIASLWEMAIKMSLGKLSLTQPFAKLIPEQMRVNGVELLNMSIDHIAIVVDLPFHHRDPFDRLLIAQALVEQLPIVSADPAFDAYGIERLW